MSTLPSPYAPAAQVAALYPLLRNDSIRAITQAVLTFEPDEDGRAVLSRELTPDERAALQARQRELTEALTPARHSDIRAEISRMMAGFNKAITKEDAAAVTSQFIVVLAGLPIWAIQRACGKWSRGEISAAVMEGVNRAFGPTTAQFYPTAEEIVAEWFEEASQVRRALSGFLPRIVSPEERERVGRAISEFAAQLKGDRAAEREAQDAERRGRDGYLVPDDDALRRAYPIKKKAKAKPQSGAEA